MTELLTADGYVHTQDKLRDLQVRLAKLEQRTDLDREQLASVRRSYQMMMREFTQDMRLYEAKHKNNKTTLMQQSN